MALMDPNDLRLAGGDPRRSIVERKLSSSFISEGDLRIAAMRASCCVSSAMQSVAKWAIFEFAAQQPVGARVFELRISWREGVAIHPMVAGSANAG